MAPLEIDEVIVARVQDRRRPWIAEHLPERSEIVDRERVDEPGADTGRRELDERQPRGIVMEAVPLGVDRDLGDAREPPHERGEPVGRADPDRFGQVRWGFCSRSARSIRWKRRRIGSSASWWVMT